MAYPAAVRADAAWDAAAFTAQARNSLYGRDAACLLIKLPIDFKSQSYTFTFSQPIIYTNVTRISPFTCVQVRPPRPRRGKIAASRSARRPAASMSGIMGVDWLCECGNMNWSKRQSCNRCQQPKKGPETCLAPSGPPRRPRVEWTDAGGNPGVVPSSTQIKSPPPGIDPSVGDWPCAKCGNW